MKLKSMILAGAIAVCLAYIVLPDRNPSQSPRPELSAEQEVKSAEHVDFSFPFQPGEERVYEGSIQFELQMEQNQSVQTQAFALAMDLHLQSHEIVDDQLFWSMRALQVEVKGAQTIEGALPSSTEAIYFRSQGGLIEEIHTPENGNEMLQGLMKSIALRMQIETPSHATQPLPFLWQGSELDSNGKYQISYSARGPQGEVRLLKSYDGLANDQNLLLANGSHVEFTLSKNASMIEQFRFDFGIRTDDSMLKVDARQQVAFKLSHINRGLPIGDVSLKSQEKFAVSKPSSLPSYGSQNKKKRMQDMLGGASKAQVLALVGDLEDEHDVRVSNTFDKLEALLYLHPKHGKDLLDYLDQRMNDKNISAQLSLIMGAISTMEAKDIEEALLDFAQRYDRKDVELQTSFALAELKGSSDKVYDHLHSMSKSPDLDTRSTGMLSLGVLGRQGHHRDNVGAVLRAQLERDKSDKGLALAALNNSRDSNNLEVNLSYIDDQDSYVASQAVYGLGQTNQGEAYQALVKILKGESREAVLQTAVDAMAGHLDQDGAVWELINLATKKVSDHLMMRIVNVLAGSRSPEARDFVEALGQEGSRSQEVQRHAQRTLLTMSS
ncbi:HEAT repeat domain-containing protein [Pseudobacteriovorax antillogorgiicola]|uniref:HEAT repeat-containing protein n=1 Tax=Pseudobacteriovorax antillogorgiicola TaxID=1513793 RepID=A0A1Y6BLK5_9BACT|nr:hypothetical protein [Pseudobacteriovorax antillogorgiicola]TCS54583.1 hypothetical protein EDD56_10696 [Pseudobacteriovorax antillogorgiicola]SMF17872.1 hypothetical protein SAMN06296036_106147 [Pseudobacteriovorax antillogorgiicola]